MPRDRQRAKQRQAERRAERLAARRAGNGGATSGAEAPDVDELEELVDLEVGAPDPHLGRSDVALEHGPHADEGDHGREARPQQHHERGRVVAFLIAVWAELGRVQWPNRQQLTQLTGVVLFFVIIIGAYLGALDAIFSKVVNAIL